MHNQKIYLPLYKQTKKVMKIAENRKNDIAVEEVTFKNDIVSIDYYLPEWNECKTLEVSAYDYENHLNDINALEWSMQVFQGNEYVNDIDGKMTLADYFADVDIQEKNNDAVSYLKANCVDYAGLPDIFGAIAAITKFPNPTTYPTANINVLGSGQPASEFNVNQNK